MGAGALTICHSKAAVQIKEDMKKMVQLPILRPRAVETKGNRLFGVSLLELNELGLVKDGVPRVVLRMVEHLREHGMKQEGLFRVNGNVRAVETLKRRLESGEEVDFLAEGMDICTLASLLKQYFRDLPEGLVDSTVRLAVLHQHQESTDDGSCSGLRELLLQLPDVHYALLRYLCQFLTQVDQNHKDNRMTALNLATVFGPNVFHVSSGFEGMKEQNICNKIMAKLIQNYSSIFEHQTDCPRGAFPEEHPNLIIVKEAHVTNTHREMSAPTPPPKATTTVSRKKKAVHTSPLDSTDPLVESSSETSTATPRKKKVRKARSEPVVRAIPHPSPSDGLPHRRPLPSPLAVSPGPTLELSAPSPERIEMSSPPEILHSPGPVLPQEDPSDVSPTSSMEALDSSQDEERPMSPFYMSNHLSPVHCRPDLAAFLERTISSAVEQHLFEASTRGGQSSEDSDWTPRCPFPVTTPTARQRRRLYREEQQAEEAAPAVTPRLPRDMNRSTTPRAAVDKENLPSYSRASVSGEEGRRRALHSCRGVQLESSPEPRKAHHLLTLALLTDNQDARTIMECTARTCDLTGRNNMESSANGSGSPVNDGTPTLLTLSMKIQESLVSCDTGRIVGGGVRPSEPECESCEDVPCLDLTSITEDNNWGDPVPAYSSWQRESMDREEARVSPHAGGHLLRQLVEEDSDPMLSPRFYAYGHSQQYLDDTEVPPSPPNSHAFVSRRRSSSLGSCDDEREELTTAQLSKKIHALKRKIRKFEEKFEEERKYRPSHGDKACNPEILRLMNELSKLRKDLKEHKLLKSEEDLPPVTRQRSNTLPKSFGSQLEKKPQQEKAPKPPVESTLEVVQNKLREKREEVGRPDDIKDMTREQIGAEKVALQKALLYYESIHGRPVTKGERLIMKPLYDRYRLVKQILCRASTIPIIGSPSSKRRGPLLQPIIEGVPALFFDDIKEEEDGSDDDGESKPQFSVTVKTDFSMLGFLEQLEEEADGFISPVDDHSPSKNPTDMRLSNLHSATMPELVEQLQDAREEKKRIRTNLREFEDQFFRQNGRNVQKEDRSPLAVEYNEYKHIKAKLRLLEVLISKRDSSKFI